MAISNRNMTRVLSLLRGAAEKHKPPVITLVAQMSRDPFRVLIATMLSLRTKDEVTATASARLFAVAKTPRKMLSLPERKIATLIYPVGFYKTKAKSIKRTCKILLDSYNGAVPDDIDTLVTLPGVGRKTANLVLIEGFGKHAMCVDTHVHRISNRWGFIMTKTPDASEQALREKLPRKHWLAYNELLVGFGQRICQPVSPKCTECPLKNICPRVNVTQSR